MPIAAFTGDGAEEGNLSVSEAFFSLLQTETAVVPSQDVLSVTEKLRSGAPKGSENFACFLISEAEWANGEGYFDIEELGCAVGKVIGASQKHANVEIAVTEFKLEYAEGDLNVEFSMLIDLSEYCRQINLNLGTVIIPVSATADFGVSQGRLNGPLEYDFRACGAKLGEKMTARALGYLFPVKTAEEILNLYFPQLFGNFGRFTPDCDELGQVIGVTFERWN